MKIRAKLFIGYMVLVVTGFYFLAKWVRDDMQRCYLEATEETMIDAAHVVAASLAEGEGGIDPDRMGRAFVGADSAELDAKIYDLTKLSVDLDAYVTDAHGIVLGDSGNPANVGADYSRWNDVARTLRGAYGARATRLVKDDPLTTTLYVSAPIKRDGKIIGVVSVYKPVRFIYLFIEGAKERIIHLAVGSALLVFILGALLSVWLTRPLLKLRDYALAVRDGRNVESPDLGGGEIGELGRAFEEMREALEGKKYVENYVQSLTHELKSPIAAVKGALEFFEDDNLHASKREKLLRNLNFETDRMSRVVERMLLLAALENRRRLRETKRIDLNELLAELVDNYREANPALEFVFEPSSSQVPVLGERFLLYQAFDNLLRNAVEFSSDGSTVQVRVIGDSDARVVEVLDSGFGIPPYAVDRIFERFYSLPRPESDQKSTGLGLSVVKEIAALHGGTVALENRVEGGVKATFTLPAPIKDEHS